MKYRALQDGTIGKGADIRRIRKGEVFTLPEGLKPGKWMEEVPEPKPEKPRAKKAEAGAPADPEQQ